MGRILYAHPATVLFITPLEMAHPVAKRLDSVRHQLFPDCRNVAIKKRPSNLIQLTAHTHLTSQGLGDTSGSEQMPTRLVSNMLLGTTTGSHPLQLSQRTLHADH